MPISSSSSLFILLTVVLAGVIGAVISRIIEHSVLVGEIYEILYTHSDHPRKYTYLLRNRAGTIFVYICEDPILPKRKYFKLVKTGFLSLPKPVAFDELSELGPEV